MRGPEQEWKLSQSALSKEVGSRMDRPDIRATEIADYAYCARSWWLKRVQGVTAESEGLHAGMAAHEAAGQRVATVVRVDRMVKGLVWILVALVALGVLVWIGR